jgi:Zn-dependent peptidase ImmA (M78 family)
MTTSQQAEEVLTRCNVRSAPVPVEKIAAAYNITLRALPASDDISGAIVRTQEKVIIAVNPTHAPTRQRFTIAHELGHFFFHKDMAEHVEQDLRVSWRRVSKDDTGIDWREVQANKFAAELLMPEDMLMRDLDDYPDVNRRTIENLARRYQVSPLAMQIRLTSLGLIPSSVEFG